jgi:hypothetical protein
MTDYKNELEQIDEYLEAYANYKVASVTRPMKTLVDEYPQCSKEAAKIELEALLSQHSKKRELEARVDENQRMIHKGVCEVMCGWSRLCDKKPSCVPFRKRISKLTNGEK